MPVIEADHQGAVRPVHRKQTEDEVIDDQRRDLGPLIRHGFPSGFFLSRRWLLLVAGEAVAVGFLIVPDARSSLGPYFALFLAGSALSLLAARSLSASGPGFVLVCGALFRLTLLWRPPDLSDDIFRYLWDGRVAQSGLSPYAYVPEDPALAT